jgi:hypothetical protein
MVAAQGLGDTLLSLVPRVPVCSRDVQKPTTTRKTLEALQGILVQTVAELEAAGERRDV